MPSIDIFPDIELVLITFLTAEFGSYRFVSSLPEDMTQPTTRVKRVGGTPRDIRIDRPIINLDTFDPDYQTASLASRTVQSAMMSIMGLTLIGGTIQSVSVIVGSRWLPDPNPAISRFSATYEAHIHV